MARSSTGPTLARPCVVTTAGLMVLASTGRVESAVPLRVVEQTAHDPYRLGEGLTIGVVEPRQALIDRGAAVGMNLSQHGVAPGGEPAVWCLV